MKLDLIRDLLDKQLVDRSKTKIGRVDGLVIELRDGAPPVVDHFQLGSVVLARRIGPRTEALVKWIRSKIATHSKTPIVIRWPLVGEITEHHIKLAIPAEESGAIDAEQWLSEHVVKKIPGSHR